MGLRCGAALQYEPGALFVPRFDRQIHDDGVQRLGMESAYAALGVAEPGVSLAFEDVVTGLAHHVDAPKREVCELVCRDAVAWALGDTDNHGRNTALLKPLDGSVALSPLFDFAPMYLDPELVKRSTRWRSEGPGEVPDWADVCTFVEGAVAEAPIRGALAELGERLTGAVELMRGLGVDESICERRAPFVAQVAAALRGLEG